MPAWWAQLKFPVADTMSATHWDIPPELPRIYLNFRSDNDRCGSIKIKEMQTNTYFFLQDESSNVFMDTMLVKFRIYTGVLSLKHQITLNSFMLFHSFDYTVKNNIK